MDDLDSNNVINENIYNTNLQIHHQKQHPFHIVDPSPWPITTSLSLFVLASGGVMFMHNYLLGKYILLLGSLLLSFCLYGWWKDVIKEGLIGGNHTKYVRIGLRLGMVLFIISEIIFFCCFFFGYFKARLFPPGILDGVWVTKEGSWPPIGVEPFDPWDIPLMNTLILLLSGTTVTWAHYALDKNNIQEFLKALGITIILGIMFTCFQAYEYHHAMFKFTDGIYASNFYMATGFHGLHVIIGTIFLIVCYFRGKIGHFSNHKAHLGFEFAEWYWHFVDIVWLFLFVFIYILGR